MPRLSSLLRRSETASRRADTAIDTAAMAKRDLDAEARRIAWAALAKRGIRPGDMIGLTDPQSARYHDRPARLAGVLCYRGRDLDGRPCWVIRLRLATFSARGRPLKTPIIDYFCRPHPRDIAREVVKVPTPKGSA